MIISQTPYRISFFGGGTDYPEWYREHGGAVFAATIDKYCYLTVRELPPFFEHHTRVVYSRTETCSSNDQIQHPSVRAVLSHLGFRQGLEIHHNGDLPSRSGMGSSSAFTVGLLHALRMLNGDAPDKAWLASQAIHVEQDLLQETVGSQDQVLAAFGGLRHVQFRTSGEIFARPVAVPSRRLAELGDHLMLHYTGITRVASEVARTYAKHLGAHDRQLKLLGGLVNEALAIVRGDCDLREFGKLMHDSWQIKRSLSNRISNTQIDETYAAARLAGATGGKLLGAGGGGFMLLFVPPERQAAVRNSLKHLVHVPFRFESSGSRIIFNRGEADRDLEVRTSIPDTCAAPPSWPTSRAA